MANKEVGPVTAFRAMTWNVENLFRPNAAPDHAPVTATFDL